MNSLVVAAQFWVTRLRISRQTNTVASAMARLDMNKKEGLVVLLLMAINNIARSTVRFNMNIGNSSM